MNKLAAMIVLLTGSLALAQATSQPATLTIQPISYFEQNCARCHGDYGANYGAQFARNLNAAQLAKTVDDMCSGPGNAPLSGLDLQAEIAFHRALADHKPFICVEKIDGQTISGEVTPGAELSMDGQPIKTTSDGVWTAQLSSGAALTAKLKDATTELKVDPAAPFSHAPPK